MERMNMEHRAYVFDHRAFEVEYKDLLVQALSTATTAALEQFIETNRKQLTDPYEGKPLPPTWRSLLESGDVQEYGDFGLTKYYDPQDDIGFGASWSTIDEQLAEYLGDGALVLGHVEGPEHAPFDPGRSGSYFQTPEEVARNLRTLRELHEELGHRVAEPIRKVLEAGKGTGLYVTF